MFTQRQAIRQRGFFILTIFLLVLFALGIFAFTRLNSGSVRASEQDAENRAGHVRIRNALISFASSYGYLPCPADGAAGTGAAVPVAASVVCTAPAGTVPWATLGLTAADAIDAYQNKISYRVYTGVTGLTQARGASMTDCDSVRAPLPVPQTVGIDAATGLCRADHDTSPAQFLAGKGLSVTDSGALVGSVAFVLVSHGRNGAGAFNAAGVQNALPNAASAEYGHTRAAGPFVIKASNTTDLAPYDPAYFDDEVSYITIDELLKRAGAVARDWPDPAPPVPPPISSTTFTSGDIAAAAAAAGAAPQGTSTNTNSINVNGVTISSASTSGGAREISSLTGTSGYGIGVISTTATTGGTISNSDLLTLAFGTTGQKLALMLVDFGSVSGQNERAHIVLKNGGATVLDAIITSCRSGSQLASYSIPASAAFDRVEISALTRSGSTSSSSFLLGSIALCAAAATSCTTGDATATTACAYP